jgi:hypothetical protein
MVIFEPSSLKRIMSSKFLTCFPSAFFQLDFFQTSTHLVAQFIKNRLSVLIVISLALCSMACSRAVIAAFRLKKDFKTFLLFFMNSQI